MDIDSDGAPAAGAEVPAVPAAGAEVPASLVEQLRGILEQVQAFEAAQVRPEPGVPRAQCFHPPPGTRQTGKGRPGRREAACPGRPRTGRGGQKKARGG